MNLTKRTLAITAGVTLLVVVLSFAWWFFSPLFISKTVDEPFPPSSLGPTLPYRQAALIPSRPDDFDVCAHTLTSTRTPCKGLVRPL